MAMLWCNGEWWEDGKFASACGDRGGILGLGLFETILAVDGRPVFLDRHLDRLRQACGRFGWLPPDEEFPGLPAVMAELLEKRGLAEGTARIRLAVTAGSGSPGDLASGADRLVWMGAVACGDFPREIAVMVSPWVKNERSAISGLKCASYAENVVALDHARRLGFQETLFFNASGHLCEAAMANVFVVRGGEVLTPPLASGCLPGIARQVLLESGFGREENIAPEDLDAATEVFLTSAIRGPVAVCRIGERILPGEGVVGEVAAAWRRIGQVEHRTSNVQH